VIGGAWITHVVDDNFLEYLKEETLKERVRLGDLAVDGRMLEWILNK
jgi:hypothetical protein